MFQVDMFKGQAFSQLWTILLTQTQPNVREKYQSPLDIAVNFHFREILVQDHFSSSKKLQRFERETRGGRSGMGVSSQCPNEPRPSSIS